MKFVDYIKDCLKDKEFLKAWEEENSDIDIYLFGEHPEEKFSVKYVSDSIFELRTKQSSGLTRIFYFFYHGNRIILTNGHIKKSQNLNEKEFEKAKRYRDIYLKHR